MKRTAVRVFLSFIALLLFYIAGVVVRGQYGFRIAIGNQSGEILKHAALKEQTHGPRYDLGDIEIGQRKHLFIQPKTEAHIELLFDDAAGRQHSGLVVGYVEGGYCGRAEAVVQPGGRVDAKEHVDILFCKGSWLDFI
jgi:hypothetical protein